MLSATIQDAAPVVEFDPPVRSGMPGDGAGQPRHHSPVDPPSVRSGTKTVPTRSLGHLRQSLVLRTNKLKRTAVRLRGAVGVKPETDRAFALEQP